MAGVEAETKETTRATMSKQPVIPKRTSSQRSVWSAIIKEKKLGRHIFDEIPTLRKTPWELDRKNSSIQRAVQSQAARGFPSHIFASLPTEIYHCILMHLRNCFVVTPTIQASDLLQQCLFCCLVSKRWLTATREHLYGSLWLLPNESIKSRRRSLLGRKSRLELLKRTLTEERQLAHLVYRINVCPSLRTELTAPKSFLSRSPSTLDLLRELVDLCPNIEEVIGFLPELNPRYASHFQTLLRRPRLRSLALWTHPGRWFLMDINRLGSYEENWHHLDTLVLSQGNSTKSLSTGTDSILGLIGRLPALQRLALIGLSKEDFDNAAVASLPQLTCLRLDHLPGVADAGIDRLGQSPASETLRSLTLNGLELKKVTTILNLLRNCFELSRLRVVQTDAPAAPFEDEEIPGEEEEISSTLAYLHWETVVPGEVPKLFADMILEGLFPALHTIKAPCDLDGHLQAVCRPIHEKSVTQDDHNFMEKERRHGSAHSIRLAQLRAQLRIQESRRQPSFNFVVEDLDDNLKHTEAIGSFLGRLNSTIQYSLEPDIAGHREALAHFTDLTDPKVSTLDDSSEYCPDFDFDVLF